MAVLRVVGCPRCSAHLAPLAFLVLLFTASVAPQEDNAASEDLICPPVTSQNSFLTLPCNKRSDCLFGDLCCPIKPGSRKNRCFKGVPRPLPELDHEPFFGVVPRACPNPPVLEILPVTNCTVDADCWPRVCCPDGRKRFCRTPAPHWEKIPGHENLPVATYIRSAMKYLQCSAPPEPIFDLFPRVCGAPQDCFPDLCCQEGARKVCRKPRKSLFTLLSSLFTFTTPAPKTDGSDVVTEIPPSASSLPTTGVKVSSQQSNKRVNANRNVKALNSMPSTNKTLTLPSSDPEQKTNADTTEDTIPKPLKNRHVQTRPKAVPLRTLSYPRY